MWICWYQFALALGFACGCVKEAHQIANMSKDKKKQQIDNRLQDTRRRHCDISLFASAAYYRHRLLYQSFFLVFRTFIYLTFLCLSLNIAITSHIAFSTPSIAPRFCFFVRISRTSTNLLHGKNEFAPSERWNDSLSKRCRRWTGKKFVLIFSWCDDTSKLCHSLVVSLFLFLCRPFSTLYEIFVYVLLMHAAFHIYIIHQAFNLCVPSEL